MEARLPGRDGEYNTFFSFQSPGNLQCYVSLEVEVLGYLFKNWLGPSTTLSKERN